MGKREFIIKHIFLFSKFLRSYLLFINSSVEINKEFLISLDNLNDKFPLFPTIIINFFMI